MRTFLAIVRHPAIFVQGIRESGSSFGMTYDDDPESRKSRAYDSGRNVGDYIAGEEVL
jgi:hypothetical protein